MRLRIRPRLGTFGRLTRSVMRRVADPRWVAALLFTLALFAFSACATLEPTPEQQSARAAWDSCPKSANLALASIAADGLIRFRAVSSPSGARALAECLRMMGVPSTLAVAAAP